MSRKKGTDFDFRGFSKRLKSLRYERKYSQKLVAQLTNVSRQSVNAWENGNATPTYDTLVKLCDIYNVSSDYLLDTQCTIPPKSTTRELCEYLDVNLMELMKIRQFIKEFKTIAREKEV